MNLLDFGNHMQGETVMQNPVNSALKQIIKRKKLLFGAAIVVAALVGFYTLAGAKKAASGYVTDTVKRVF